ncbi:MAG: M20 family metallo-hydrolase [candidate division KSB1 bacterium]|nr:M20 family metallo-hydrolase [candidate division KSB1 bacterium]
MQARAFSEVAARIEQSREEVVRLQTELTAIPALAPENGGEGEQAKAAYVKELLSALPTDELLEFRAPDARVPCGYRPNLVAKYRGTDPARTVWVLSHLDIVPPGELALWHSDPYRVRVDGDLLYGRGVEDNQQSLVASLLALRAIYEAGLRPKHDVGLVLVADEETGSQYGLQYLLREHRELFGSQDWIVVPDSGNADGSMVEVAEKSILWIGFKTIGKQCHGSRPSHGKNAHKAGAHLIVKLDKLYEAFPYSDPVFMPPTSTFEPTKKEANVPNINTIPGEDVFYFDCRILPTYKVDDVIAWIESAVREVEAQFGVRVEMFYPQREEAAPPTSADAPVVQALARALAETRGVKAVPMGIGGGTVAAHFRRAGLPAAVWETIDQTAHQPNEYCRISNVLADAKVLAHLFLQS